MFVKFNQKGMPQSHRDTEIKMESGSRYLALLLGVPCASVAELIYFAPLPLAGFALKLARCLNC